MNECCPTRAGIETIKYLVARSQVVLVTRNTQPSALLSGNQTGERRRGTRGPATETRGDGRAGWPHTLYTWFSSSADAAREHACTHTHTCAHTHAHTCTHMRNTRTRTHAHAHTRTCTHTHTHACTYTRTHTRSSVERLSSGACNLTSESLGPGATSLHLRPTQEGF